MTEKQNDIQEEMPEKTDVAYEDDEPVAISLSAETKKTREPLFHVVKRDALTKKKAWGIRALAILASLIVCSIVILCVTKINPFSVYGAMISGVFSTGRSVLKTIHSLCILLCISLAVTPAFKMRFWNIGAEGQVLMGGLVTVACMFLIQDAIPNFLLIILSFVCALIFGAVWGVIPAVFKAKWGTNETLFTLMMNYVAMSLVTVMLCVWNKSGAPVMFSSFLMHGRLPKLFDQHYIFNILVVVLVTVGMFIYLKYSKHGYEIAVVGESENTARYVGINVKWVIIRTMLISGALCGLAGFLLVAGVDYTITVNSARGYGFDAIMVSWLAKFNPLYMIMTSFLLVFFENGGSEVSTRLNLNDSFSEVLSGIILFFIIGCEFFVQYQVKFRSFRKKEEVAE